MKRLLAICLSALLTLSCGTIEKKEKTQGLEAATNAYGKALRWGYWETAYGYLHPGLRTEVPGSLENIRVTAYDVVQPAVLSEETQARQVAQIEYVRQDEQVVRKVTDRQDWRYDGETEAWWLHSPIPAFR